MDELQAVVRLQMHVFLAAKEPLHALIYPSSDPPSDTDIDRIANEIRAKQQKERENGAESLIWAVKDEHHGHLMAAARWVFYPPGSSPKYSPSQVDAPDIMTQDSTEARARVAYLQFCYDKCLSARIKQCQGPHASEFCSTLPRTLLGQPQLIISSKCLSCASLLPTLAGEALESCWSKQVSGAQTNLVYPHLWKLS